ncbi:putative 4-hydroxy-4-methyl-2-oxoglutarate aldolase [Corallincola platygyrae]|uniref:4-hydroxy-4-methyl-2-oxoglutarate aldolase n=1 Tax=Corallincola platygyrae TaxID=1193278 RepID=A0ABW4XS42_9GAMM
MLDLLPDLYDLYSDRLRLLNLNWKHFGDKPIFWGPVQTVSCFEDNSKVAELLASPGDGQVLLVDGAASHNRALLGDNLAQKGIDNGWAGVVINGCMRDAGTINQMPIGVKALGTCPIKTDKRGQGEVGIAVEIAGIEIHPGEYLYADLNGIAVSDQALAIPNLE